MEIRGKLKEELTRRGAISLMQELTKADPISAERIHINDEYRLRRALEVFRLTGRPLSSFASPWSPAMETGGQPSREKFSFQEKSSFRFLLIGLRRNREELYRRINERCAAMFRSGLADEVRRLFEAGYTPEDPGLRAIGYREFFVKENKVSKGPGDPGSGVFWRLSEDLAGVEALIAQNSRRYAKRQITFFASIPEVRWIDCGEIKKTARELRLILEEFLDKRKDSFSQ
jgi:tRNA dimethylallyltransferase